MTHTELGIGIQIGVGQLFGYVTWCIRFHEGRDQSLCSAIPAFRSCAESSPAGRRRAKGQHAPPMILRPILLPIDATRMGIFPLSGGDSVAKARLDDGQVTRQCL